MANYQITSIFTCLTCDTSEDMNQEQVLDHLKTVHRIDDPRAIKWKRDNGQMYDMGGESSNTFDYTSEAGDIKLRKNTLTKRIKKENKNE